MRRLPILALLLVSACADEDGPPPPVANGTLGPWTPGPPMPVARANHASAVLGGDLVVLGGNRREAPGAPTFVRTLHEEPEFIPGYFDKRDKRVLKENQVITIEPFISSGAREVFDNGDGWTLVTSPGVFTAQYEHTLVITKGAPLIMTLPN